MYINPLLLCDFYKLDHRRQYPEGTNLVYSNLTARKSRVAGHDKIVFFGLQYFLIEYLQNHFNKFFNGSVIQYIRNFATITYKSTGCGFNSDHLLALHRLGYLPLEIKALPEGSLVPIGVPMLTIKNTHPDFAWITNYIETILSATIWGACTSATTAYYMRKNLKKYSNETCDSNILGYNHVDFQAHDFSFRGMFGLEAACISGASHLLIFQGTDCIPALDFIQQYYYPIPGLPALEQRQSAPMVSIPATEHSVMCAGGKETELETFKRLLTEVYPSGPVSIVSDTWDLWSVITNILPQLKDIIMTRDGKLVIRPDSGDPVEIICGDDIRTFNTIEEAQIWAEYSIGKEASSETGEYMQGSYFYSRTAIVDDKFYELKFEIEYNRYDKRFYYIEDILLNSIDQIQCPSNQLGIIRLLWNLFGGAVNDKGYKVLDPHIGVIYGDSITYDTADTICRRLQEMGFASINIVFGVGSYIYQYTTRDTYSFAMKSTYVEINGEGKEIFKDPVTDDGTKRSAKGLLCVDKDQNGELTLFDLCSKAREQEGLLETVFKDGKIVKYQNFQEIRNRLYEQ